MERVEEDTHQWDFEWHDTAVEFALPLQLPPTLISGLLKMGVKK